VTKTTNQDQPDYTMSFLAKLFLNGRVFNVLDTDIRFYQKLNAHSFKPATVPMGGLFNLTLEADGTTDLLSLVLSHDTMCDGMIRFYKNDGLTRLCDYEFFDTHIVSYLRSFEGQFGNVTTDTYKFSPGILRIGDMVFEKSWKISDLSVVDIPPPEPEEPKQLLLKDFYLTDKDNNRIEETTIGETVTLNIKTQDMIGEMMTIDLNNPTADFMYNGMVLENDTLKDIVVSKNLEKIRLKVVEPSVKEEA